MKEHKPQSTSLPLVSKTIENNGIPVYDNMHEIVNEKTRKLLCFTSNTQHQPRLKSVFC